MSKKEIETYCPSSKSDWRKWLMKNHCLEQSVWLIYFRASTKIPSLTWSEAVDEALCFGWIDSIKKTIDEERYMQYFSRRKPTSAWSKINKEKVAKLIRSDRMTEAGLECIRIAKQNGTWSILDAVEALIIPEDLKIALKSREGGLEFFEQQSKSLKKQMLYWVVVAKRVETRKKRIREIAHNAGKGMRPKPFR